VPPASLAVLVLTALVTVALGFAGFALSEWFGPFLTEVFA
jgi:multicomponent Na+:H+ antiporter subunit D